jgi:hypothetical protein
LDSSVAALHLCHVADQHRRANGLAVHHQWQRAQQHCGTAGVDLHAHAGSACERVADVVGQFLRLERITDQRAGDGDQVVPLKFGGQRHAVISRDCVGAGEYDDTLLVEADEPVADSRAGA